MKKIFLLLFAIFTSHLFLFAQLPGDTIITNSFNYNQTYKVGIRDTLLSFPDIPGITFEKIIMLYNMRCKNGTVGNNVTPQSPNGCGEWDYSCNTYITDSSKIDSVKARGPSHTISGFTGTTFPYTTFPTFTYYKFYQQQVSYTSTINETIGTIGAGNSITNLALHTQLQNGKSQYLYMASELLASGITSGNISSLRLFMSNIGSDAAFLKIKMKHTSQSFLSASTPNLEGFTEVYFLNTSFINGVNQFNFYNNFTWNGVDNILVDFSFSNSNSGIDNMIESDTFSTNFGLVSNSNDTYFEFDGTNKINAGTSNLASITNQISICFWANGNANVLPANSSILEGVNAANQRQVNIHLPWSNSNIYWDCGNGTSYDRISAADTNAAFAGKWNHWAYTKNSTTGIMNIYLNGTLWLTGSGKTIPVAISNLIWGSGANNNNPYFGKVDDLQIWNTELSQTTIQNWMNKSVDNTHPNFASLQNNYLLNDAAGNSCLDASSIPSNGSVIGTPLWKKIKGKDIFKNLEATNNRPKISFVQGVYTQSTNTVIALDSVVNNTNTVKEFMVTNNDYNLVNTNTYYQATPSYVFSGDSLQLLDSITIVNTGTINITTLPYVLRSPSRYQIMSFVTPYGNGLDLGANGKTYSFDVSDFGPILKGKKRMTMDAGGQWQEDMDIKFLFIVGTPPRDVKSIINVWKVDYTDYNNIIADNYFEPRTLLMDANGKSFKMRTAITGHGQEGEFIPQNHSINLNAGADEFTWQVVKGCAENPVYPQGGTWLYDRAGWCPGMATYTKENDITPFVTAGSNVVLDYNIATASGDSRYWISNQLVTYGGANFVLDAAIIDIKNPSKKVEHARSNAICSRPIVTLKNTGSTAITNVVIEYWVNNHTPKESFTWVGNLGFMESVDVILPYNDNLWGGVNGALGNVFFTEIKTVNTAIDNYVLNNKMSSAFDITGVVPSKFIVQFKSNNNGAESKYQILDGNGNPIFVRDNMANNTIYKDTFALAVGCYQLLISDAGEDGLNWWANPNAGAGFCNLKKINGSSLKTFNPDFGKSLLYNFTIDYPLHYEDIYKENLVTVFPNPAHQQFIIEGKNIDVTHISLINTLGQKVQFSFTKKLNQIIVNCNNLPAGNYMLGIINEDGKTQFVKVTIQ